jgi:hypothetical protein
MFHERFRLLVFTKDKDVVMWADYDVVKGKFDVGEEPIPRTSPLLRVQHFNRRVVITRDGIEPTRSRLVHYRPGTTIIEELIPGELEQMEARLRGRHDAAAGK